MPKTTKAKDPESLNVCLMSDTHELHREVEVPYADVLIHAGDFSMMSRSVAAIRDFNLWLGELPHRHKIVVPGNHEFFIEADPTKRNLISNATVLINEGIEIMGLRIWGSPTTMLFSGAFGLSSAADRRKLYAAIPDDIDILITHGPPFGILDRASPVMEHAGCPELLAAVLRVRPKLHVFGHVHGSRGLVTVGETVFVNAALLGPDGDIDGTVTTLRMPRK